MCLLVIEDFPLHFQFKVLQEGCWQKLNFNDTTARSHAAKDKWLLLANPWIQRFAMASSSKMHTRTPLKFSGRASWASEKRACCEWKEGVPSSSKINVRQIPMDCSQKCELQNYASITGIPWLSEPYWIFLSAI